MIRIGKQTETEIEIWRAIEGMVITICIKEG